MALKATIGNFKETARYHGWGAALQLLFTAILRKFIGLERVYVYLFHSPPPELPFPTDKQTRLASAEEVHQLARHPEFDFGDFTEEKTAALLKQGHKCLLNLVDGEIAGYAWMDPDVITIPKLQIKMELKPEEVYVYKGFTHPKFRGKHLGMHRYMFWMKYLPTQGRSTVICDFSFDNKATLTRVDKLRMDKIGTATWIRIGSWTKLFRSGTFRTRKVMPL